MCPVGVSSINTGEWVCSLGGSQVVVLFPSEELFFSQTSTRSEGTATCLHTVCTYVRSTQFYTLTNS